jgi:hypothetical protein
MGSVTLIRDTGYVDAARAYKVLLDGAVVNRIKQGATLRFEVPPGEHHLQLKIDWCSSRAVVFSVADNDNVTFHVKSNLRSRVFQTLYIVLFARDEYILLEQADA